MTHHALFWRGGGVASFTSFSMTVYQKALDHQPLQNDLDLGDGLGKSNIVAILDVI
jgi:hypothetical protein